MGVGGGRGWWAWVVSVGGGCEVLERMTFIKNAREKNSEANAWYSLFIHQCHTCVGYRIFTHYATPSH